MEWALPLLLKIYCLTETNSQAASDITFIREKEDLSLAKVYMEAFINHVEVLGDVIGVIIQ